jgi:hypothetical protein
MQPSIEQRKAGPIFLKIVCAEMLLKIDKKAFIKENETIAGKNQ